MNEPVTRAAFPGDLESQWREGWDAKARDILESLGEYKAVSSNPWGAERNASLKLIYGAGSDTIPSLAAVQKALRVAVAVNPTLLGRFDVDICVHPAVLFAIKFAKLYNDGGNVEGISEGSFAFRGGGEPDELVFETHRGMTTLAVAYAAPPAVEKARAEDAYALLRRGGATAELATALAGEISADKKPISRGF